MKNSRFVAINNITLDRVSKWKLLGVIVDENLTLSKHVSLLLKDFAGI